MIASKKAVIEAHNADVEASKLWIDTFLRAKEVRKMEDLPGPNPVLDRSLAGDYGWDPLNGGLGQVSGLFWFAALGLAAKIEAESVATQFEGWQSEGKPWKYTPGDFSFDPAGLRGKIADKWADTIPDSDIPADSNERVDLKNNIKQNVELAEIMHGRAAMLAVTGFALQEAIYQTPIVDQTPIFFATPVYSLIGAGLGGIHDLF